MDVVQESVCEKCKNSLEESQVFTNGIPSHSPEKPDHSENLEMLEKELAHMKEKHAFQLQMENELKSNLESQVDVVIKMEDERVTLMKKNQELTQKCDKLKTNISDIQEAFQELRDELKHTQEEAQRYRDMQKENKTSNI